MDIYLTSLLTFLLHFGDKLFILFTNTSKKTLFTRAYKSKRYMLLQNNKNNHTPLNNH